MDGGEVLEIPKWLLLEINWAVHHELPNEACGAVLRKGDLYIYTPMTNVAKRPRLEYAWSAEDHLGLLKTAENTGMDIWIIYHSHTETAPEPSDVDKTTAWHVGVHYLILSAAGGPGDLWYRSYVCPTPGQLEKEEVRVL